MSNIIKIRPINILIYLNALYEVKYKKYEEIEENKWSFDIKKFVSIKHSLISYLISRNALINTKTDGLLELGPLLDYLKTEINDIPIWKRPSELELYVVENSTTTLA